MPRPRCGDDDHQGIQHVEWNMAIPTDFDDRLLGTALADTIDGLKGNDIIEGFDGNDRYWATRATT